MHQLPPVSAGSSTTSAQLCIVKHTNCRLYVDLVVWPVKILHEMTYNVLSETLNLYTTITRLY